MTKVVLVVLAVLSIGLLFGVSQAVAASGEVVWKSTFDGGQIVIGEDSENNSIWMIKTDADGTEQANHTFNGSAGNYGEPFQQTSDGGRITVNNPDRPSYGSRYTSVYPCDIQLIKEDANRTEQWRKIFRNTSGGTPEDVHKVGKAVIQTSDNGYIIVGYKIAYGCGPSYSDFADLWVIKTDQNGTEQWDKTFTTSPNRNDFGRLILQTSDGGYVIAANGGMDVPMGGAKVWLIKIDEYGTKEWDNILKGYQEHYSFESIHQIDDDGGYVIVGSAESTRPWNFNPSNWIIKINACGRKEWEEVFKEPDPIRTPKPIVKSSPSPTQTPETSGFEAIFAIAGLSAIAYLLRMRRKRY